MKTHILAPALALAALSLAACGPKTGAGNTAAATDTLTLNEEGDASLGNSDAFEATGNDLTVDNGATADNLIAPAEGNAL
jgi:predicted small secreted protein